VAEEPTATPPKGKGSAFKGKIAGVPKPLALGALGVALYLGYRWYKNKNAASTSSTATPTATTGTTPDTTGGYTGGGGGGGDWTPPTPGTPAPTTPTPGTTSPTPSSITPIGNQVITVGGKAFNTVANFTQNGSTYYGIDNPTEAKALEAEGVTLERNPNDPSGKGLFAVLPAGAKSIPVKAKSPAANANEAKKISTSKVKSQTKA
jgi:hypothetical protein